MSASPHDQSHPGARGTGTTLGRLGWIAAGYAAAAALAAFLVHARYWFIDPAVVDASSGMFAGGDLIGFVLLAGFFGLAPTFFLLRLATDLHPRALAGTLLALSLTALPALWLISALPSKPLDLAPALAGLFGVAIALLIFPRVIAIPIMLVVLGLALLLARDRWTRSVLAFALLLEAVPLVLLVLHFLKSAIRT